MDFIGNKKHVQFLTKALASNRTQHAYLFVGPENIGKRTLAQAYAQALIMGSKSIVFGENEKSAYAGDLFICRAQITKEKKTASISIDDVRDNTTQLTRRPYHDHARVLIVDDAHQMTQSAQNALLKTLEEPSEASSIILVSSQPELLLPTLHSRCATLTFSSPSHNEIMSLGASAEMMKLGLMRPGKIKRLLSDQEYYDQCVETVQSVEQIGNQTIQERFSFAHTLAADRVDADRFLTVLLHDLHARARATNQHSLFATMEKVMIAKKLLTQNVNTRLVLENLFIAL